jgi:hypothetical protein
MPISSIISIPWPIRLQVKAVRKNPQTNEQKTITSDLVVYGDGKRCECASMLSSYVKDTTRPARFV